MLYSSGTTGRPKGILRPLADAHPAEPTLAMAGITHLWRFREGMTYLSPAPLYHTAPQVSVALTLRLGATAVVMEHFDAAHYLDLVGRYGVTHSQVVPTMFSRLLKLPDEVRAAADVSSLEVIVHAAAPCPVPVKEQMIEWFGPILLEYYGATEGNGCTFCDSEDWLAHPGTVGRSVLGKLLILDDEGRPCPAGTPGTVWFRGATDFEYFNDRARTDEDRIEGGATSTVGDVGYLDEDGYLFLTGRTAECIISGGVNIVQPSPGAEPGADLERELLDFCRQHLAHYKCPRSVDFDPELPRLPTGKLYKLVLRERYWGDRDTRIV